MGTTLTGTTPQDTYDSLIKVTDNGPLSGTAKYLSDGLGNDSVLALSTAAVGVGTTSNSYTSAGRGNLNIAGSAGAILGFQIGGTPKGYVFHDNTNLQLWNEVAGDLLFGANATERMRIASTGNVAIGTSNTGFGTLGVFNASNSLLAIANSTSYAQLQQNGSDLYFNTNLGGAAGGNLIFRFGSGAAEYVRFPSTGGITFNGDTAAANALDDYEEGTWTPTISFGGASVGVTYTAGTAGRYTKIGRQVSVTCYILLTSKGSSTGKASIEGLPFAISGGTGFYSAPSFGALSSITYVGMLQGYGEVGTGRVDLVEITEAGVQTVISDADFTNATQIVMQFTYFV